MLTLVAMADTHGYHAGYAVPPGDILIHAGDFCRRGSPDEVQSFCDFLAAQPHRHKIVVAGNHDRWFEDAPLAARALLPPGVIYLEDEAVTIEGIRFYGSPWQPEFHSWAFNLPRGPAIAEKWARIPEDTQVLITHGPPYGYGDQNDDSERVGCEDLLRRVRIVRPRLHIFGHIHEDPGQWREGATTFVNVTTNQCAIPCAVLRWPLELPGPR
ncbi:metallophosphatase domain-containing protein [Chondromyces apiculatus]|uniref:Calcineurin-like phosphoesterase domain-containing protein n=1 Tax=Chondromyces apiculatus DSM 436 TaxID=1192034 RepID=A0A017SYI7_9BACT|nr:metallophosphatase domain-containing protein [Chondromyces apiculatus]EYF01842.1 Hypothetical protein CAP_7723 [Chondromyces apiculatus DSM 436]